MTRHPADYRDEIEHADRALIAAARRNCWCRNEA
jgi:hypothetical protein